MSKLTERYLTEQYEEMLDSVYDVVSVCGYEYAASTALLRLDPVAYRQGLLDWVDAQVEDGHLPEEARDLV